MAAPDSRDDGPDDAESGSEPPSRAELDASARAMLAAHWRPPGFTCPHATTYRWLWLWDSCFHSVIWAHLGEPERAVTELATALSGQADDGFVPHLGYLDGTTDHSDLWGRTGWSSITQPPVFGWTVAELRRRGVDVPDGLIDRATRGLRFLIDRRRRSPAGLIEIVHPWESGCDHSPRWDDLVAPDLTPGTAAPPVDGRDDPEGPHFLGNPVDPFDEDEWFRRKGEIVTTIERTPSGSPVHNDRFAVGSVAFSAITAWAAIELGRSVGNGSLVAAGTDVTRAIEDRWDPALGTYVDDGPPSGRIRTAEALLPLLVETRRDVVDSIVRLLADPSGLGGAFGVAGVDRREPTFRPRSYWRGPSWPQIDFLLWSALVAAGRTHEAEGLARRTVAGAWRSGWSEYWDADDATGGGAAPQSWAAVACLMVDDRDMWKRIETA